MKTVVLANQKGGVGKSAVATLLVHHLIKQGLRVLAIDLDHQRNMSKPLAKSGRLSLSGSTAEVMLVGGELDLPKGPSVLIAGSSALLGLERQPALHTPFARQCRRYLEIVGYRFDVCVIDTNPNPDIRVISALASADYVLSPIQLNQEAMDGVSGLLNHERVGVRKIKGLLNPKLELIGLLPTLVEPTPFQKANFVQVVQQYRQLLIPLSEEPGHFANIPKRSAIAEAQAHGEVLWEMKKTAARDAWREIEPTFNRLGQILAMQGEHHVA